MTKVVVVGLGYVGLPLAMRAAAVGHSVIGFDIDTRRVKLLEAGESYIEDVPSEELQKVLEDGTFRPSSDGAACAGFDVAVVAAPTPLRDGLPDLSYLEDAARTLAGHLRPGATVIIESTSYPGTTQEKVLPILEEGSGPGRGLGVPPRLQPGADRPGQHDLDAGHHPEGRVRDRRGLAAGGRGLLLDHRGQDGRRLLTARGRAGQAGGEHLPARQHRARQRAGHVRPRPRHRRVGSDRGGVQQAVRLHAVPPRARGRRPLPARSTRPTSPGGWNGRSARASASSSSRTTSTVTCRITSCTGS